MNISNQNLKHIFDRAMKNHQSGHFKEAEKLYNKILRNFPDHFQSIFLLGTLFAQIKNYEAAIILLKKTIKINPEHLDSYNNLGNVYREIGSNQVAIPYYQKIIKINPHYIEAHNNLGKIYNEIGKYSEAISFFKTVIKLNPKHIESYNNLGVLLKQQGQLKEATYYYKKVLEIDPEYIETLNNFGALLRLQKKYKRALNNYEKVIKINPKFLETYINIGNVLNDLGKHSKAIKMFQKANEINSSYLSAYWLSLNTFPVIYKNIKELDSYRNRFIENINKLNQIILKNKNFTKNEILKALSTSTNFYLHYQGKNDLVLQTKYAKIIEKLTKKIYPQFHRKRTKKILSKKIKIGFISSNFTNHTVAEQFKNWIIKINRNFFSTFVYLIGNKLDQTTNKIKRNADSFFNHTNIDVLINQISKDNLNVLVYTDIGMEPVVQVLSSLRLADIQCTTYGHPVTSGFKHIDYFFSSKLMEKNDSQKNYSEKLIKLPNIAIDFDLPNLSKVQKLKNIKKTNKIIFLNLQSLFKLLPSDDHIYFDIIKKINNCQFWFIEGLKKSITTSFKNRIAKFCRYYDISFNKYFLFHQRMNTSDFFNLIKKSDIVLDSLEWSGGKTSLETIAMHKPIVTLPGELMRGRYTYAILKMLKLEEVIASSKREYIEIAIKLATDKNFKNMIINKIKTNKNALYNDSKPIKFLENFFKKEFKI